jgi:hypothetical protein
MQSLVIFAISILRSARALFRGREEQAIVELALRKQPCGLRPRSAATATSPLDRTFWVALSRLWPQWRNHLVVVRPETVVRWHR